jgi:transposase
MLGFPPMPAQVWLVVEPVDMRLGIDGLAARIQQSLGRSPCDGTAYAFRHRRGTRIKLLQWDLTGVWLSQRRLHRGDSVSSDQGLADRLSARLKQRCLLHADETPV